MDFSKLDSDALRELAHMQLGESNPAPCGDFRLNPKYKDVLLLQPAKPAAVLIPVIAHKDGLSLLLTKRADKLRDHSGQIAFPGGKIDASDADAVACATRESEEEINLDRSEVEVLGQLPDYISGSGFKISPVLALIKSDATFSANEDEVDFIFQVPFSFVLDANNFTLGQRNLAKRHMNYFQFTHEQHHVWGITAGIVRLMRDLLLEEDYLV